MDFKQIQSIIKDFEKSNLKSLELELEGFKLKLNKDNKEPEIKTVEQPQEVKPVAAAEKSENQALVVKGFEVKSPLVGTYYSASSPKEKPFVNVGSKVEKGQTLCIIEAMKIINEITSPVAGTVEAINVKNGSPVGFDQVLMVIV
jgi:acetyl-CoA carboxylase biotin carboxyl carrier protein